MHEQKLQIIWAATQNTHTHTFELNCQLFFDVELLKQKLFNFLRTIFFFIV